MPVISIRIPQLGEGLQEALLVEFLKQPGDAVKRDEPIYVMETDKATTDVESPYAGELVEWTVEPGTVLQIGSEIGRMSVAEGVKEMPAGHAPAGHGSAASTAAPAEPASRKPRITGASPAESPKPSASPSDTAGTDVAIPPRTRKYLKEKGLLEIASQIPAAGSKLMPEDVDRYLASQPAATARAAAPSGSAPYDEVPLAMSQITLNYRLTRGTQVCVPVTVMTDIDWTRIEEARERSRTKGGPTAFAMGCWAITQTLQRHDKLRSALSSDGRTLKRYRHVNLGVAVALPGDEMVTAVIAKADTLDQASFFAAFQRQVELARNGQDQADEATTITISNIGKAGMRIGIPAIVAPAVATLAIGEVFDRPVPDGKGFRFIRAVTATLSFDHRVLNGVGAGNFLSDAKAAIEAFKLA